MNRFLIITLGAAFGANARYLISLWAANRFGADFPYGTMIVNVSGSFVLGFILALTTERLVISPETRVLLAIGFIGSYTTFSTYSVESLLLFQEGSLGRGLLNIVGNNILGLTSAVLGTYLARWIQ